MAHDPDTIFKALRMVPEFDGNSNVLTRFIRLCDQVCATYLSAQPGNELSNEFLINGILNKITGPAARTLNSNGIPESWQGIRNALINNFSDQRDETALYNDLALATQGNNSPQEFYDRCVNLFSTIMTYVTLHETVVTTIDAKRTLYKKLTTQAFVRGLKEPLGSRIRCMRPDSVEKALEYVQEELNVLYLQQRNDSVPNVKSQAPRQVQMPPALMPMFKPFNPPAHIPTHVPFQRPTQSFQAPWKPNFPVNRPTAGPSRTQQIFRAPPPNFNQHGNSLQLPHRNSSQNPGPQAMSGVSPFIPKPLPPTGMTGHDWSRRGNPPPNNYFKTREMNFNECSDYDDYSYYPDYYIDYDLYYNSYYHPSNYDQPPMTYEQDDSTNESYEYRSQEQGQPSTPSEQDFHLTTPSKRLK